MEISSFSLYPSLDDLYQNYSVPFSEYSAIDTRPLKKRRGEGERSDNTEPSAIKDFLASILMFGDEDHLKEDWMLPFLLDYQDPNAVLNENNSTDNQIQNHSVGVVAEATIIPSTAVAKATITPAATEAAIAIAPVPAAEAAIKPAPAAEAAIIPAPATAGSPSRPRNNKRPRSAATTGRPSVPPPPTNRRLWVKDRSKDWWEKCNQPDYPDEEFKKYFRMSKATFNMIVEELQPTVTRKNTALRDAIPVHQRVAVCIYRLATGEPLREVSKRFGLGISTCHKLVLEVCAAIKALLLDKFLRWPEDAKMSAIRAEFEAMSGIPNIAGSMYTTHVPIIAPKGNVGPYFNKRHTERNQKTTYTMTVQGVVDPNGIFTDICIGWPGSYSDDLILDKSALSNRVRSGGLKDAWVVGNSNHPLMDWCMVPYSHQNLTWTQHNFNDKIDDVQKVARDAFYRLKKRWACLQRRTEVKLAEVPVVLGACCILHNICELRKEEILPEPENEFELFDDVCLPEIVIRSAPMIHVRDHIAHNLLHHGHFG